METELAVPRIVEALGKTISGRITSPNEGRIAKNYVVPTKEEGAILVRVRPLAEETKDTLLEYGVSRFEFEAKVLDFLSQKGVPVPTLLQFPSTDSVLYRSKDALAFCYPLLDGAPIQQSEIDNEIAVQSGKLTHSLITVATEYTPVASDPDGDIDYIARIVNRFISADPSAGQNRQLTTMLAHLNHGPQRSKLEVTPRGIVHGDLFFENVIRNAGKISGLIDFGDAYVGNVLMDVTTASMEFSVKSDGEWSKSLFTSFLRPIAPWLSENKIDFETFHYSLLANCVRFAGHTLNLDISAGNQPDIAENQYVRRFQDFSGKSLSDLRSAYADVLIPGAGKAPSPALAKLDN